MKLLMAPLQFLASLRLTVILLSMAMFLIFAGTMAQVEDGIMTVTKEYFRSYYVMIPLGIFIPDFIEQRFDLTDTLEFLRLPFPGAHILSAALMLNLIAAHIVRFKMAIKRIGIIALHIGLIILLTGEIITGVFQKEGYLHLGVNETRNFVEAYEDVELAIIDGSDPAKDRVTVIPQTVLETKKDIDIEGVPFSIRIERWMENSDLVFADALGPQQRNMPPYRNAGALTIDSIPLLVVSKPKGSAIHDPGEADAPAAMISIMKDGQILKQLALTSHNGIKQSIEVDGKTWDIDLRPERSYRDYSFTLTDVKHEIFIGTEIPKNFQSTLNLVNHSTGESRENIQIFMNNPLRYAGETYYQKQMDSANGASTLLVVDNPGWLLPYISCAIITLGMVVHFTISLVKYLRRYSKKAKSEKAAQEAAITHRPTPPGGSDAVSPALLPEKKQPQLIFMGLTVLIIALGFLYVSSKAASAVRPTKSIVNAEADYDAFGRLPVSSGGRVKPMDTVARNKLMQVSNRSSVKSWQFKMEGQDKGTKMPAIEWLTNTMSSSYPAHNAKIFKIELPALVQNLQLDPNEKYFSWKDLEPRLGVLVQQAQVARNTPNKSQSYYQKELIKLTNRIGVFQSIYMLRSPYMVPPSEHNEEWAQLTTDMEAANEVPFYQVKDPTVLKTLGLPETQPVVLNWSQMDQAIPAIINFLRPLSNKNPAEFTETEKAFVHFYQAYERFNESGIGKLYLLALSDKNVNPDHAKLLEILLLHRMGEFDQFNEAVQDYLKDTQNNPKVDKTKVYFEIFYNKFSPDTVSLVLYTFIFILTLVSFLTRELSPRTARAIGVAAFGILLLALMVHTFGLGARIYIQGRPPVTNLYSSAIFVGWGVVLFAAFFEYFNRLGFATSAASLVGVVTTIIAINLAESGDTMQMMQAVLDSNFWLATHVIIVTLGYVATLLAGTIAVLYILTGFLTPWLTKTLDQKITRMVYGVICFAMLFSFVGTVLGGIWADQSWGRFWGWDPKENGAALVVLIAAIILHARWGGIIKNRGIMVLSVFGNIITAWAWFGVNLLEIGLHSYGFMDRGVVWMVFFCVTMFIIMLVGMTPRAIWMSTTIQKQVEEREKAKAMAVTSAK